MFKHSTVWAVGLVVLHFGPAVWAQGHRSSWMWTSSTDPYGSANIVGDPLAEVNLIRDFQLWGFDRVYTSLGNWPSTNPERVAGWNARLDDAGIQSHMLMAEPHWVFPESRASLMDALRLRVVEFNADRADPREWIDAVHLDIEPHTLAEWREGTDTDRHDLMLLLRDTYADIRLMFDMNGQSQVRLYADLPTRYDSTSTIAWAAGERDQWFADIAGSLDSISLMAYERSTLDFIDSGVWWEIENFHGEVRIGLESNAVGPGETWPTFEALLDMADALEVYYGEALGGIDFHPLATFAAQAEHAPQIPQVHGDLNYDGYVGIADLNIVLGSWNQAVTAGSQPDPSGDGFVGLSDLGAVLGRWNDGVPPTTMQSIPEPLSVFAVLSGTGAASLRRKWYTTSRQG